MRVKDILNAFENKTADVTIIGSWLSPEEDILATWDPEDNIHPEWGQLSYFNTFNPNPLEKYYLETVKSFDVWTTTRGNQCMIFITI